MGLEIKKGIENVRYPAFAEIKIDGELIKYIDGVFENDYGTRFKFDINLPNKKLIGEMYADEGKDFYVGVKDKIVWFDMLDLIGQVPFVERRHELKNLQIPMTTGRIVHDRIEVEGYFEHIIHNGFEGLVVKPLDSLYITSWVKLKKRKTCYMYVRGIRKDTDGSAKGSVAVGTKEHIYGCCSVATCYPLIAEISQQKIIGDNKDYWFIDPNITVEVDYIELIQKSRKFRSPVLKRIVKGVIVDEL